MSSQPFRLRAGDVIWFERQPCQVVRVNECAAVIALPRAPREFVTASGRRVCFPAKPALARISPDSACPILNRLTL